MKPEPPPPISCVQSQEHVSRVQPQKHDNPDRGWGGGLAGLGGLSDDISRVAVAVVLPTDDRRYNRAVMV